MLPWFPRDYLAATRSLTLAERGAYTDLLFYSWDIGALPDDTKRIARMLGVDESEFAAIWPAIQSKFVRNEGQVIRHNMAWTFFLLFYLIIIGVGFYLFAPNLLMLKTASLSTNG